MAKRLWITWEVQRRNRSMSQMLGAQLHEIVFEASAWCRYPVLIVRTIALIWRVRPEIIFSQNPSLVLAGLSVTIGKFLNTPVVIDAHNAGMFPLEGKSKVLNVLAKYINNGAASVIVSNVKLQAYIEENGGSAYVIPDPIPTIECKKSVEMTEDIFKVVFVCSWAEDEPYMEVIAAAHGVASSVRIYITGNSKGRHVVTDGELPENIELTGFLSIDEYEALLCACDAVMVLTTREDCLVCGAYEGVAVEKPLILSNTASLKQYFNQGSVYTENIESKICEAINSVVTSNEHLECEVKEFKIATIHTTARIISEFERQVLVPLQ